MELTKEQRDQILQAQRANILKKLKSGKTLTAREQAILEGDSETYVRTREALASALGVDPKTVSNKIRDFAKDPRLPGKRRGAESDGRYNVPAWRAFLDSIGVQGKSGPGSASAPADNPDTEAYWKKLNAKLQYDRGLYSFEVEKQKHVSIEDITAAVGQMLAGFRTALNMLPGSAARWLIGLKDFHAIKEKLQSEVDGVLQALGRCRYLDELAPAVVDKLFSDRPAEFRKEVAASCAQVFQELGRLSLEDLLQRDLPAPASPQPEKTALQSSGPAPELTPHSSAQTNDNAARRRGKKS